MTGAGRFVIHSCSGQRETGTSQPWQRAGRGGRDGATALPTQPFPTPTPQRQVRARGRVYSLSSSVQEWGLVRLGAGTREGSPCLELRSPRSAFWEREKVIQKFPPPSPSRRGPTCRGHLAVLMALSAVPWSSFRHRASSFQISLPSTRAHRTVIFRKTESSWGSYSFIPEVSSYLFCSWAPSSEHSVSSHWSGLLEPGKRRPTGPPPRPAQGKPEFQPNWAEILP